MPSLFGLNLVPPKGGSDESDAGEDDP